MRNQLLELLDAFSRGDISILFLRQKLLELIRNGLRESMRANEKQPLGNLIWCLDMYDPHRSTRKGLFGRVEDFFGRFKGDYRMTENDIHSVARKLERTMHAASPALRD